MDVDAALVCGNCAWFGVFRSDVATQLTGCPNCGCDSLVQRDLEDPAWQEFGAELLRD